MKLVRFSRKELYWIERTADIESGMAMQNFSKLVNTDISKLDEKEKETIKKLGSELIDLYIFLKELRTKLEIWDCRYDIDKGFKLKEKEDKQ